MNINEKLHLSKKIDNFIYCCGKTGSSTLNRTLPNSIHMHSFLFYCRVSLKDFSFPNENEINFDFFDIVDINMKKYNQSHVYFYDIYRTPFERKISAFFQHFKTHYVTSPTEIINDIKKHPYLYSYDVNKLNKDNFRSTIEKNINLLIEIFWWTFMISTDNYYSFEEYRGICDFNIQNEPYYYQDNGKYRYVVLKYKNIKHFSKYLQEIHGKKFEIKNANITSEDVSKDNINNLYDKFKKNFKIPSVLLKIILFKEHQMHRLHKICNHHKVMKKFMTETEIKKYIEYWKSKSNDIIPEDLYDDTTTWKEIYSKIIDYFKNNPRYI